jgi:hypothetical protein
MSEHTYKDTYLDNEVHTQYRQVRRRAFWNQILDLLTGDSHRLLSFDLVQDKLRPTCQVYGGTRPVEVAKIVGSVGRYRDFDRSFLPLQDGTAHRWKAIAKARLREESIPPVKLYQVGDAYFVRDGHHRVSVAREQGATYVDAEIIECRTRVPITPDVSEEELDLKAEYAEFLEETDLDQVRPEQQIEFTTSGSYKVLLEQIAVHRYFLGMEREEPVSWQEAVLSWYDSLYCPIVEAIRQHGILEEFPGRTESDLYLWIIEHHYYLSQRGEDVDFAEAAERFAEEHDKPLVRRAVDEVRGLLGES